jgi:hypothetical protein
MTGPDRGNSGRVAQYPAGPLRRKWSWKRSSLSGGGRPDIRTTKIDGRGLRASRRDEGDFGRAQLSAASLCQARPVCRWPPSHPCSTGARFECGTSDWHQTAFTLLSTNVPELSLGASPELAWGFVVRPEAVLSTSDPCGPKTARI